jgi:pimeloyl-ACP methyl ester carboxylesterase
VPPLPAPVLRQPTWSIAASANRAAVGDWRRNAQARSKTSDRLCSLRAGTPQSSAAIRSAGGHLALWLAGEIADLAGVVALAPVASLRLAWELGLGNGAVAEFLQGSPENVPERYQAADPENRPSSVPRVLIHGTADEIVPIELSREYVRLRGGDPAPVKLIELPAGDHFDVVDPQSRFHETVNREVQNITL